jgi:uncharacterized protein YciI
MDGLGQEYTTKMRKIILGLLLAGAAFAQSAATKQHFLIRVEPVRPGFVESPTKVEEQAMGAHFAYLKKLLADGKVIVAGPSINGPKTFGIMIVEVDNEAEARAIMAGDPAVKAGVQKAELLPFRLALLRQANSSATK